MFWHTVRDWSLGWGLLLVLSLLALGDFELGAWWLPLHSVLEIVVVAVAAMIYAFGRKTLILSGSRTAGLVGHLFLLVAFLDAAHLMSVPGMPDWLTDNHPAKALAFALLAHWTTALALWLVVATDWKRPGAHAMRHAHLVAVLLASALGVPAVALLADWFAPASADVGGLRIVPVWIEAATVTVLLATLWRLARTQGGNAPYDQARLVGALLTLTAAELCILLSYWGGGGLELLGHVYKAVGCLMTFRVLVSGLIREPYRRMEVAEADASKRRGELDEIFQAMPDAVVLVDAQGLIQNVNSRFAALLGYELGEVRGLSVDILVPERLRQGHHGLVDRYMIEPSVRGMGTGRDLYARRRDGSEFPIDVALSPVVLDGQSCVIASIRDISERAQMLRSVRASEMRLRNFLDNSVDWVWESDTSGVITYSSRSIADLLGIDSEQATGRHLLSFAVEGDALELGVQIREIMMRREPIFHLEFDCVTFSGEVRTLQTNARPFHAADGSFAGYRGLSRDVTRQCQLQNDLARSERVFRHAFDDFPIGMAFVGANGELTRANSFLCEILDYSIGELDGMPLFKLFPVEQHRDFSREILSLHEGRSGLFGAETRLLTRRGEVRWVRVDAVLIDATREQEGVLMLMFNDLTDEMEAKGQSARLLSIIERMGDTVAVADRDGRSLYLNPYGRTMLGIGLNEDISHEALSDHHLPAMAQFLMERALPAAARNGVWEGETIWVSRSGEEIATWHVITAHKDARGEVEYWTTVARDIRERKLLEDRLSHQATHDALTGLPNRLLLRDRLQQAMALAKRERKLMAVVFIDLDNFKRINDTLGHSHGDLVLQECARRLRDCMRSTDTLARQGGDEFIALLAGVTAVSDVVRIIEKMIKELAQPFFVAEREMCITASVGVSVYPFDHDNSDELLRKADVAMYRSKEQGRNCYCFYSAEMDERFGYDLQTEIDLRHAIGNEELFLMYQPKVSINTNALTGYEALVRWQHPQRGLVPPSEFIMLAERSQLIVHLGEWVLYAACRQLRRWLDEGLAVVPVSVNVSAHQFESTDMARLVARAITDTGVPGNLLELEITEGVLMRDVAATTRTLEQIAALGVSLAVDDFGTGYSSLGYLKQFPVNVLKIDRSFVEQVCNDSDDVAIVRAIISMAHELGIEVVAEGVETEGQLELLRQAECDYVQGYLFGKPLPPDEAVRYSPAMRVTGD